MTHPTRRRPSRCESGHCVTVAFTADAVLVSDSKLGDDSPVLTYTRDQWDTLLDALGIGYPPPDEAVKRLADVFPRTGGGVCWTRGQLTEDCGTVAHLDFDAAEWSAFVEGAQAGEFDLPEVTA